MKVRDIISRLLAATPGPVPAATVDTLKCGNPDAEVSHVVTTFLATCEVLERAAALGAQMVVTHEPTFYNHLDSLSWAGLDHDPVASAKRALIERLGLAVFRFHDAPHRLLPDGILAGVLEALGWSHAVDPKCGDVVTLPPTPVRDVVAHCVARLAPARPPLTVGNLDRLCRRVGVLVGASGGQRHIRLLREQAPDLLLCGEVAEWETSEYVRDAVQLGLPMALAVLGHAPSEEAGMRWLADWMRPLLPGVQVTHIPAGDALRAPSSTG